MFYCISNNSESGLCFTAYLIILNEYSHSSDQGLNHTAHCKQEISQLFSRPSQGLDRVQDRTYQGSDESRRKTSQGSDRVKKEVFRVLIKYKTELFRVLIEYRTACGVLLRLRSFSFLRVLNYNSLKSLLRVHEVLLSVLVEQNPGI